MEMLRALHHFLYFVTTSVWALRQENPQADFRQVDYGRYRPETAGDALSVDRKKFLAREATDIHAFLGEPSAKNIYENLAFPLRSSGKPDGLVQYKLSKPPFLFMAYIGLPEEGRLEAFLELAEKRGGIAPSVLEKQKALLAQNQTSTGGLPTKLKPLLGASFALYYRVRQEQEAIAQSILHIEEHGQLALYDHDRPEVVKYRGEMLPLETEKKLVFGLRTAPYQELDLRITIDLGTDPEAPLYMGTYTNVQSRQGTLEVGTLAMVRLAPDDLRLARLFPLGSMTPDTVPMPVQQYLWSAVQSHLESPQGIYSLPELAAWLQEHPSNLQPVQIQGFTPQQFDVFLAVPNYGFLGQEQDYWQEIHGPDRLVEKLLVKLKELFGVVPDVPARVRYVHPKEDVYLKPVAVARQQSMQELLASRLFVLVMPEKALSSALVEYAFATMIQMPAVVLKKRGVPLPHLLSEPTAQALMFEYDDFDQALRFLEVNQGEIRQRMKKAMAH